jgi:hypothetical protein
VQFMNDPLAAGRQPATALDRHSRLELWRQSPPIPIFSLWTPLSPEASKRNHCARSIDCALNTTTLGKICRRGPRRRADAPREGMGSFTWGRKRSRVQPQWGLGRRKPTKLVR